MRLARSVVLVAISLCGGAHAQPCEPAWYDSFPVSELHFRDPPARAAIIFDDGSGPAIFAGVYKWGGPELLQRWRGGHWEPTWNQPFNGSIHEFCVCDLGDGPRLYTGGLTGQFGGIFVWNGTEWTTIDGRLGGQGVNRPQVYSLVGFDDGTGPALYVGGPFATIADQPCNGHRSLRRIELVVRGRRVRGRRL